ncbi:FecR family protein [Sunxiuqinia sp. sy24]|uniref:FecR family protein n=1 Tax=Sunxiuqinia sp. sy24 TaxID=3461495 RepID=UPI0040455F3D
MHKKNDNNTRITAFIRKRQSLTEEQQLEEAGKIIDQIKAVDVTTAWGNVSGKINKPKTYRLIFRQLQRVAAVLFLPVLLLSLWSLFVKIPQVRSTLIAHQEVTSPIGCRTKVELPDGTHVWLNAESTIKFPVPFIGQNREVELLGEAYFEVTKNKDNPFLITSNEAQVTVLGTSFNFRSYPEDQLAEVVLKEGTVRFESGYNNISSEYLMKPNNRLVVNKRSGELAITDVRVDKYIAWHQNKLVFDESSIDELAEKLERWYGVEVILQGKNFQAYRFSTTFENESLQHVIDLLELSSPINIEYKQAEYKPGDKTVTKSKIIITKR